MTLTLEIAPETLQALAEKAQRAGVPLTAYAVRVLEHDATDTNGAGRGDGHLSAFLLQAQALKSAGVDGAAMVRAGREERMERLSQ